MHDCNRILGRVASAFAETLWPTRCVGCELPGTLLCARCRAELPYIDARAACPACGAPYGMTDCTECGNNLQGDAGDVEGAMGAQGAGRDARPAASAALAASGEFPFAGVRAALSYEGVAKRLISAYKDKDELRLDSPIATLICQAMRGTVRGDAPLPCGQENARVADWTRWADALVAVPASVQAVRRRGFDHMARVGELCAEQVGLPLVPALRQARRVADQRGLGSGERSRNRAGSFELAPDAPRPLPGRIVLIDDVLTTGATAAAATEALFDGGARKVVVAVCARVW